MWAALPATPEVVTLPLTDLSMRTAMVPLPVAAVLTGGTSWLPLSVTFEPLGAALAICCWALCCAHPAARSAATLTLLSHRDRLTSRCSACIGLASLDDMDSPMATAACGRIYRWAVDFANMPNSLSPLGGEGQGEGANPTGRRNAYTPN